MTQNPRDLKLVRQASAVKPDGEDLTRALEAMVLQLLELHDQTRSEQSRLVHRQVSLSCTISSGVAMTILLSALMLAKKEDSFVAMSLLGITALGFLYVQVRTLDTLLQSENADLKEMLKARHTRRASVARRRRLSEASKAALVADAPERSAQGPTAPAPGAPVYAMHPAVLRARSESCSVSRPRCTCTRSRGMSAPAAPQSAGGTGRARLGRPCSAVARHNDAKGELCSVCRRAGGQSTSGAGPAETSSTPKEDIAVDHSDSEDGDLGSQISLVDLVDEERDFKSKRFALPFARRRLNKGRKFVAQRLPSSRRLRSGPIPKDKRTSAIVPDERTFEVAEIPDGPNEVSPVSRPKVSRKVLNAGSPHDAQTASGDEVVKFASVFRNAAESKAVQELRRALEDDFGNAGLVRPVDLGDLTLLRFLRSNEQNITDAEKHYRDTVAWRRERRPDIIYEKLERAPHPITSTYMTGSWCGHDRTGAPVMYDRIGQLDLANLLACASDTDIEEFHIWKQEVHTRLLIEAEQRTGKPQYQVLVILDMTGLSWRHFNRQGLRVIKRCIAMDSKFYCERLKQMIIINAGTVFSSIWGVVKHFVDDDTRQKIFIHRNTPTQLLKELIDPEQLPKYLSGNLEIDGDPYCAQLIKPGGPIPSHVVRAHKLTATATEK